MLTIITSFLLIVPAIGFIAHITNTTFSLRDEEAYQLWSFNSNTSDVKITHKTSNFADYI